MLKLVRFFPSILIGDVLILCIEERNVEDPLAPVEKRAPAPALSEGVNLNMAEGQVAELTFVETRAVGDDDE